MLATVRSDAHEDESPARTTKSPASYCRRGPLDDTRNADGDVFSRDLLHQLVSPGHPATRAAELPCILEDSPVLQGLDAVLTRCRASSIITLRSGSLVSPTSLTTFHRCRPGSSGNVRLRDPLENLTFSIRASLMNFASSTTR